MMIIFTGHTVELSLVILPNSKRVANSIPGSSLPEFPHSPSGWVFRRYTVQFLDNGPWIIIDHRFEVYVWPRDGLVSAPRVNTAPSDGSWDWRDLSLPHWKELSSESDFHVWTNSCINETVYGSYLKSLSLTGGCWFDNNKNPRAVA